MDQTKVYPGKLLGTLLDFKPTGNNVYVYLDSIYAGVKGTAVYQGNEVSVLAAGEVEPDFADPSN